MAKQIPEHIRQRIVRDYLDGYPAFLSLASRYGINVATVGKILHAEGIVKARKGLGQMHLPTLGSGDLGVTYGDKGRPWTEYELALLRFVANGMTSNEMLREVRRRGLRPGPEKRDSPAHTLGKLSLSALQRDINQVLLRLGAKNRAHAVQLAHEKRLLGVACQQCGHDPTTTPSPSDASDSGCSEPDDEP